MKIGLLVVVIVSAIFQLVISSEHENKVDTDILVHTRGGGWGSGIGPNSHFRSWIDTGKRNGKLTYYGRKGVTSPKNPLCQAWYGDNASHTYSNATSKKMAKQASSGQEPKYDPPHGNERYPHWHLAKHAMPKIRINCEGKGVVNMRWNPHFNVRKKNN